MNTKSNLKVVAMGGGTGLSILLSGLKTVTKNITAVVNVIDDGGSSGRLREDLGMLPPGDIRACLVALANTESELQRVFQYRFTEGELDGQSFGNLFLAAMSEVYGGFDIALQKTSDILAITGRVFPMTLEDVALVAELEDGTTIQGESEIPVFAQAKKTGIRRVYMNKQNVTPLDKTLHAIEDADIILLGPGSLYTSVMPNILVDGIVEALTKTQAPVIYIANVMTQSGETDGYGLADHYRAIVSHAGADFIDEMYYNTEPIPESVRDHYFSNNETVPIYMTEEDQAFFHKIGVRTYGDDFLDVRKNYIRHNSTKLCEQIVENQTRIYRG